MNKNIRAYGHIWPMEDFLEFKRKGMDFVLKYYNEDIDGRFCRQEKNPKWKYPRLCHDTVLWNLRRRLEAATGTGEFCYNVEYLDDKHYAVIIRTRMDSKLAKYLIEDEGYEIV